MVTEEEKLKKNALEDIVKLKRQLYFSIALNVIFGVWVIIIMNLILRR